MAATLEKTTETHTQGIHYRVLVIDQNKKNTSFIERLFVEAVAYVDDKLFSQCKTTKVYTLDDPVYLSRRPNASAFNAVFIHVGFPGAIGTAQKIYKENPFCYVLLYGDDDMDCLLQALHARPVAYFAKLEKRKVWAELEYLNELFDKQFNKEYCLRLVYRNASFDIPISNIPYCKSQGRTSYIHVNTLSTDWEFAVEKLQGDKYSFINTDSALMAYTQNVRLDILEEKLSLNDFIRVHQSYLVNRSSVEGLTKSKQGWQLTVVCGKITEFIPVSEKYHEKVEEIFG